MKNGIIPKVITKKQRPYGGDMMFEDRILELNADSKVASNKKSYSVKEVQQILGISRPTVYNLIKQNVFQSVKINSGFRIIKSSFDDWLDKRI